MAFQPNLDLESAVLRRVVGDKDFKLAFTKHVSSRLRARGLALSDVSVALQNAIVIDTTSSPSGQRWVVRGLTGDGVVLRLVVSISEATKTLQLITVYSADALEEVVESSPNRKTIEQRVEDWVNRIDGLYQMVGEWLPGNWSADRYATVMMHEEPMRSVGLPPRTLQTLRLLHDGKNVGLIEPRGLWIIGANGRLDLSRGRDRWVILDTADPFDPPQWHYAALSRREQLYPFNREALQSVLIDA
jgi:Domain of unknown function (DUF4258)